jgi:hypothetical protein
MLIINCKKLFDRRETLLLEFLGTLCTKSGHCPTFQKKNLEILVAFSCNLQDLAPKNVLFYFAKRSTNASINSFLKRKMDAFCVNKTRHQLFGLI